MDDYQPWKFSQCFGDKSENVEVADGTLMKALLFYSTSLADIISAVQFDSTGDFLASGDRAGRVVLFQRNHSVSLEGNHSTNQFLFRKSRVNTNFIVNSSLMNQNSTI